MGGRKNTQASQRRTLSVSKPKIGLVCSFLFLTGHNLNCVFMTVTMTPELRRYAPVRRIRGTNDPRGGLV